MVLCEDNVGWDCCGLFCYWVTCCWCRSVAVVVSPFGIRFDKIYTKRSDKSKAYVIAITMKNGIPYVGLSNGSLMKAKVFIRKYR